MILSVILPKLRIHSGSSEYSATEPSFGYLGFLGASSPALAGLGIDLVIQGLPAPNVSSFFSANVLEEDDVLEDDETEVELEDDELDPDGGGAAAGPNNA